jgi:glyoxylase-like metal-dependent hydrolase (beta-lactamase superfamily II)
MIRSLALGAMTIDLLPEIEHRMMPVSFLFNALTREQMEANASWLDGRFLDPASMTLGLAFQSYVIRTESLTILVDSCNGNHKQRPTAAWQHDLRSNAFLDNLGHLGLRCEDVDIVVCTHLHCDHVGWNTRLDNGRWVPTFPNARYLFGRKEFDHCLGRLEREGAAVVNHGAFADSVLPVVDAGLAHFVEDGHLVVPGAEGEIALIPAPGHSFGHCCVRARAGGEEALVCGDALHHPIQLDLPDLKMRADLDPDLAVTTRRRLLETCAETGSWLLAGHIPFKSISRVRRFEDRFRLC